MTGFRATLYDAIVSRSRLVILAGEPGIGKTRTAQELSSHAKSLGPSPGWAHNSGDRACLSQ